MALIRICPNCSFQASAETFFCKNPSCGTSLVHVQPISVSDSKPETNSYKLPDQAPSSDNVRPGIQCSNPDCNFVNNPESEQTCLRCGTALGPSPDKHKSTTSGTTREPVFGLRFPFGNIWVEEILRIGRDPDFSPIAARIASLDRVSRQHAEVRISDGRMILLDKGSTNKVHVNGQQIPTDTPHVLREGDKVNFSSQLQATVIGGDS